jgi:hypothetical protein
MNSLVSRRCATLSWISICLAVSVTAALAALAATAAPLGVSPLLVDAASQVWSIVARPDNPVWPGWNASDTPLLLYLPGKQELLINHPSPPPGFRPYAGPASFPGARIVARDDTTFVSYDGQNTTMDVAGVRTLVVADPLSNLRQRIQGLIADARPAEEKIRTLELDVLASDPYDQLGLIVHEAFHVYQEKTRPERGTNEMLLLYYPTLSVENNVGFGLEASALGEAVGAADDAGLRRAAVRWLVAREQRRAQLPARAVAYEDGVEFTEGLAKYTEYRLFQVLEGREAPSALARAQGFRGFGDLSAQRANLIGQMRAHLRGEVSVNNDPYGAAPLRMRLYYSGMAIGILLDRLQPLWKEQLWKSDSSLTAIAREILLPSAAELAAAAAAVEADTERAGLVVAKQKLAREGQQRIADRMAGFENGAVPMLVVDYSALESPKVGLGFSPFGITVVDADRVLFEQVPISVTFADQSSIEQEIALPLLRDTRRRQLRCPVAGAYSKSELAKAAGPGRLGSRAAGPLALSLPGVKLALTSATVEWRDGAIHVALRPTTKASES